MLYVRLARHLQRFWSWARTSIKLGRVMRYLDNDRRVAKGVNFTPPLRRFQTSPVKRSVVINKP